jgi:hypothetical protein
MADGVAITAGSGTTILTDETASGHSQVVKLAIATDGSATLIPADATLGIMVNPSLAIVDDAAFTPATSKVIMAGFEADEGSTDSVDEGDAGAGRMTLDRKQIVNPQPHTAGGLSIFRSIDLDETEEEVKATAGQVYSMWVSNMASSTPVITIAIPGNTSDDVTGLFGGAYGIAFDTAISVAATTGIADADTGAPAANDVIANIFYK